MYTGGGWNKNNIKRQLDLSWKKQNNIFFIKYWIRSVKKFLKLYMEDCTVYMWTWYRKSWEMNFRAIWDVLQEDTWCIMRSGCVSRWQVNRSLEWWEKSVKSYKKTRCIDGCTEWATQDCWPWPWRVWWGVKTARNSRD